MPLPDILAKPIFHLIYLINRRMEGAKVVPIRRKVMPVDNVRRQIFASPDAIWAMRFAILDKGKFNLTRNGSVRVGHGNRRIKCYHFELPKSNRENNPFTEGMLYITRPQDFPDKRPFPILNWFDAEIEEWGSTQPVSPLARIRVSPQDFPYLNKVQLSL